MARSFACHQARQHMQKLLDHRWTRPIPQWLSDHFQSCPACSAWRGLFQYEPTDSFRPLSEDFSRRVVASYLQPVKTPIPRRRFPAFTAAAALLAIVIAAWMFRPLTPSPSAPLMAARDPLGGIMPVMASMKQDFDQLPNRVRNLQPGADELLAVLPRLELSWPQDSISDALPSFKSIGETLQGAVEPIEVPAREAYQKMKMLMDDASIRKWFNSLGRGAV